MRVKSGTTSHYCATTSLAPLESVCAHLQRALDTEPFELDSHRHWEYGWASSSTLHLNVTRCSDHETIETWIDGTPSGVNYQIILTCPDSEHARIFPRFKQELETVLGAEVQHFRESAATLPRLATETSSSEAGEVPSGSTLPLSWFLVAGVAAAAVILVRSCAAWR